MTQNRPHFHLFAPLTNGVVWRARVRARAGRDCVCSAGGGGPGLHRYVASDCWLLFVDLTLFVRNFFFCRLVCHVEARGQRVVCARAVWAGADRRGRGQAFQEGQ